MTTRDVTNAWPLNYLQHQDPEIYRAVILELRRQEEGLELIASENFASRAVMQTCGTWLTNKYAEGVWGRRYYGGCEMVDIVERLACERACKVFGAEYANVQPHSGSQANMAVFLYVLKPGDTFLAMDLDAGGHLTHGSKVNYSGQIYNAINYGVRKDNCLIDYEQVRALAEHHRPKLIVAGASAYPRQIDFQKFGDIAKSVGAYLLVDMAHIAGLVAAGVHPSPVPHADFVTSTTHKTLRGPRGGIILAKQHHEKGLNKAVCPGIQGGPLMHIIAAKAVGLGEVEHKNFAAYQRQIINNARALAQGLMAQGFDCVTGGTDNHLVLVDLRNKKLTGKAAEKALDQAMITVNKNKVPFDPEKPLVTSGMRLGTPAVTTRGMGTGDMATIAKLISERLEHVGDLHNAADVAGQVRTFVRGYPILRDILETSPVPQQGLGQDEASA